MASAPRSPRKKVVHPHLSLLHSNPASSAEVAELVYVQDSQPGITCKLKGDKRNYHKPEGTPVRDKATLERIRKLGIPPAYTDIWICPLPNGHLQATARAANGKKQYIYHSRWREMRNITKFGQMISFGEQLPKIRNQVEEDLKLPGLPRRKVLAAVVRLLECTLIRIGNDRYAKENDSYGLTTLTREHVDITGNQIKFEFKGKGGKDWSLDICDARIARIIKKCEAMPGYELFQYYDLDGNAVDVGSKDINDYLKEITGEDISAKCFRTWAGTVGAFRLLRAAEKACGSNQAQIKQTVAEAIREVAGQLGNTASICRKSYVHPDIVEAYLDGSVHIPCEELPDDGLHPDEDATLKLLKNRLQKSFNLEIPAS